MFIADMTQAMELAALPNLEEAEEHASTDQRAGPSHGLQLAPRFRSHEAALPGQPGIAAGGTAVASEAGRTPLTAAPGLASPSAPQDAHVQLRLDSPNVMARPFASLLNSAERERHVRHSAAVASSQYVYVPGIGVVPVVPAHAAQLFSGPALGFLGGQAVQGSAAAGASAPAQVQDQGAVAQPTQAAMPQLKMLRSVQHFWKLWQSERQSPHQEPHKGTAQEQAAVFRVEVGC